MQEGSFSLHKELQRSWSISVENFKQGKWSLDHQCCCLQVVCGAFTKGWMRLKAQMLFEVCW